MTTARSAIRPWLPPDMLDAGARKPIPSAIHIQPPPPAWTEGDVEAAAARGRQEGRVLAEQSYGARTARALERIAATLPGAIEEAQQRAAQIADDLAMVLVQALAAAFPALEARLGPREVADFVAAILPGLARQTVVSIHVASGGFGCLEAELARLPQAARCAVRLECDAAMGDADLRLVWHDGEAVRDGALIRSAVLSALDVLTDQDAAQGAMA